MNSFRMDFVENGITMFYFPETYKLDIMNNKSVKLINYRITIQKDLEHFATYLKESLIFFDFKKFTLYNLNLIYFDFTWFPNLEKIELSGCNIENASGITVKKFDLLINEMTNPRANEIANNFKKILKDKEIKIIINSF